MTGWQYNEQPVETLVKPAPAAMQLTHRETLWIVAGVLLRGQFDSIMNDSMTMLVGALVGAAFGGLIGSIMTEEHHDRTPPDTTNR